MPQHWGPGPVFVYESLLNARRWQIYAARAIFVLALLVGMTLVWFGTLSRGQVFTGSAQSFQQLSRLGEQFFYALAGIQLAIVLLAAPAATAGSICMDRARGTLLHMLVTDLSDVEIVVGKIAARLAPVFGLIACAAPVAALAALLGGIDFEALAGLFISSLAIAIFGCALALAISVWATKTHEVLLAVYLLEGLWLISLPIWWGFTQSLSFPNPPDWYQKANPFVLVFAPYVKPGFASAVDFGGFALTLIVLAIALLVLSIKKLRRVAVDLSGRSEKPRRQLFRKLSRLVPSLPGPSLDGNPILWREWHRNRPSRMATRIWVLLLLGTWAMAAAGTYEALVWGLRNGPSLLPIGFILQVMFGLLILSVIAPTVLSEERVRGSLDVLLTTPVSTRAIVLAKWWGVYRLVLLLALMPLYTGTLLAIMSPRLPYYVSSVKNSIQVYPLTFTDRWLSAMLCPADFLASGAVITSLGVLIAIWIRQLGRAVALSAIIFVTSAIGWIFFSQLFFYQFLNQFMNQWVARNRWLVNAVVSLSPIAGPVGGIDALHFVYEQRDWLWLGLILVALVKACVALLLLKLCILTFDKRMERVPEAAENTTTLIKPKNSDLLIEIGSPSDLG